MALGADFKSVDVSKRSGSIPPSPRFALSRNSLLNFPTSQQNVVEIFEKFYYRVENKNIVLPDFSTKYEPKMPKCQSFRWKIKICHLAISVHVLLEIGKFNF